MSLISGPGFSYPTLAESEIQVCCDLVRRQIRRLQKIEAGWITNIRRHAGLLDKYSQVFSDSTRFLWSNFHGRNSQWFDLARGSLVANFLKRIRVHRSLNFRAQCPIIVTYGMKCNDRQ